MPAAASPTRLDALLLEPGLAQAITDYLPYNAPQLGMLPQLNKSFQRAFKDTAAQAKQDVENDARFVALCKHIVRDLLAHLHFEKVHDVDETLYYTGEESEYFSIMFVHETNCTVVSVSRGDDACGYSVRVSVAVADSDYQVKELRTAEEWYEFAKRLEYPLQGSVSSWSSDEDDDIDEDDEDDEDEDAQE
jgi:hypothetical protein